MTHHSNTAIIAAEEPAANAAHNDNHSHSDPPSHDVEVRHRGGRASRLLSMFSCCSRSSIEKSVHFHANNVEDSVHVMIKHDKEACKRRGAPESHYTPRAPLSERLAAARKAEEARHHQETARVSAQAEDDILAAVAKADCCQ